MFNLKFNFLFQSVNDRTPWCDSADGFSESNAALVEEFRADYELMRTTEELFGGVVARYTKGMCVTSDGLSLECVNSILGTSIDLYFLLWFLDAPSGYGCAPGKFSVAIDPDRESCKTAKLCCGLRPPEGDFWFPLATRKPNVQMPRDYVWAYSYVRTFGPPTISSWLDRRK